MASGVHKAINGTLSPLAAGARSDSRAPPRRSSPPAPPRPKPGPPPAGLAPSPQRRGERSQVPEAAGGPGAGVADPVDPRAPPARTRLLGTRGYDEQVPNPALAPSG